jgi:hypothetical protein
MILNVMDVEGSSHGLLEGHITACDSMEETCKERWELLNMKQKQKQKS